MSKKDQNINIICVDNIDSTNNFLKKLCIERFPDEGTVIMAEYQNAGKGQGKNSWHSKKGRNLLVSVLLKPSLNAIDHFLISEFISMGIIDTLAAYRIKSEIKWPNDIYVGDKKIAGILVENSIKHNSIYQTIAGIGLNVNEDDFPEYLPNPTSIYLEIKKELNITELLKFLMNKLFERYKLIKGNDFQQLHNEYNSILYRKNISSGYNAAADIFSAILIGVGTSGELQLKMEDGNIKEYLFGEVQMIV